MFGCIVAGRLIQRNLKVISTGKYVFELPEPTNINHIVIFLTGEVAFDPNTGASIFGNTDMGISMGMDWKYLGILTNEKPSAVFKLGNVFGDNEGTTKYNFIEIGISIEPISIIEQLFIQNSTKTMVPSNTTTTTSLAINSNISMAASLARGLSMSLFNYMVSYTRSAMNVAQIEPALEIVPIKIVQDWYNNLLKKATADPNGFMQQFLNNKN